MAEVQKSEFSCSGGCRSSWSSRLPSLTACHLPPVASLPRLVPFCHLPSPALTSGPPTTSCSLLFSPFSTHHLLPYPSPPGPPPVSGLHSLAPVPIHHFLPLLITSFLHPPPPSSPVTSCPYSSPPLPVHLPLLSIRISVLSHHLRPHGSPFASTPLSLPLPPVLSSVLLLPLPLLPPSVLPPDSVSTQCVLPFPPAPHPPNPRSLLLLPLPSCLCFTPATLKSH